ncbi:S-layer protein [Synergistales bacterium]|nr:S-layer protein [Synergistales bacterium]
MRRFILLFLCLSFVFLCAESSLAATNPFVDVPLSHWAYDALGQLSASGVLSGYPDGLYRGGQPVTRYEMASALARALARVDATKAAKEDLTVLRSLVVEFRDELDALGVKTDSLDKRTAVVEDRLGGWKISGELRVDLEDWDNDVTGDGIALSMARLEFQRWFGPDEGMRLYVRLDDDGDGGIIFDKFFVEMPLPSDATLTVGRFDRDFEGDYRFIVEGATDMANEAWLTDRTVEGIGFDKSFSLGSLSLYVAHPGNLPITDWDNPTSAWELSAFAKLQFTENFGFDIGGQAFLGDDTSTVTVLDENDDPEYDIKLKNLWTVFAGLRFDFNPNVAFKGIYYYQGGKIEESPSALGQWSEVDFNNPSAWKIILDVKQDLLRFSSLWLEYSQLDAGFFIPYGQPALTLVDDDRWNAVNGSAGFVTSDTSIWRVGATQRWNDRWSSWAYVAGHRLENAGLNASGDADAKLLQWGLGVEFQYNENVAFALGYIRADWNRDAENASYADEHRLQFRTAITF